MSGTHTLIYDEKSANLPLEKVDFSLKYPTDIINNTRLDQYENKILYIKNQKIKNFLKKIGLFNLVKRFYINFFKK